MEAILNMGFWQLFWFLIKLIGAFLSVCGAIYLIIILVLVVAKAIGDMTWKR